MLRTVLHVIRVYRKPAGAYVLHQNAKKCTFKIHAAWPFHFLFFNALTVSDREESCEEMSVPSSPQNEAIQHSSVSTSNGISASSTAPPSAACSAAPSNHSTEDGQPQQGAAQTQPSGSWLYKTKPERPHWSTADQRREKKLLLATIQTVFHLFLIDFFYVWSILYLIVYWRCNVYWN